MRGSKKIVVMDSSGIKLICLMRVVKNVIWSGVSAFCLSLVVGPEESCTGMGRSWGRTRGAGAVAAAGALDTEASTDPPETRSRFICGADLLVMVVGAEDPSRARSSYVGLL